jgi:Na+(H+)/acetate symporter ActP
VHALGRSTTVRLEAGTVVPQVVRSAADPGTERWLAPGGANGDYPLYRTYSLLLALLFGTMGLPHVLVRFYTNRDGRAARRTTLVVVGLLGAFYLFPPVYAALGRLYAPDLLLAGRTDAVVLLLPGRMLAEPWGTCCRRW